MTKSTHRRVLLALAIGTTACDGRVPVRADTAATCCAHRDGDLAVYGFNGPPYTGHDQRNGISRRGNSDGHAMALSVTVVNSTTITAIAPPHSKLKRHAQWQVALGRRPRIGAVELARLTPLFVESSGQVDGELRRRHSARQ